MKDYSLDVLEQYDIEVNSTRKVRGAVLCDTDVGALLLTEAAVSDHKLPVLEMLLTQISGCGYERVDSIFINKEGELITEAIIAYCENMKNLNLPVSGPADGSLREIRVVF